MKEVQETLLQLEKIKKERNLAQRPMYQDQAQDFKVYFHPDKSITPGKFKPHAFLPGQYLAHPTTIKALRANILVADPQLLEHATMITCSCKQVWDKQFWKFCPSCESEFPKES